MITRARAGGRRCYYTTCLINARRLIFDRARWLATVSHETSDRIRVGGWPDHWSVTLRTVCRHAHAESRQLWRGWRGTRWRCVQLAHPGGAAQEERAIAPFAQRCRLQRSKQRGRVARVVAIEQLVERRLCSPERIRCAERAVEAAALGRLCARRRCSSLQERTKRLCGCAVIVDWRCSVISSPAPGSCA